MYTNIRIHAHDYMKTYFQIN